MVKARTVGRPSDRLRAVGGGFVHSLVLAFGFSSLQRFYVKHGLGQPFQRIFVVLTVCELEHDQRLL